MSKSVEKNKMNTIFHLLVELVKNIDKELENEPSVSYENWELFIDVSNNEMSNEFKIKYLIKLISWFQLQKIDFSIREHYDIYKDNGEKLSSNTGTPSLCLYSKNKNKCFLYSGKMDINSVGDWLKYIITNNK